MNYNPRPNCKSKSKSIILWFIVILFPRYSIICCRVIIEFYYWRSSFTFCCCEDIVSDCSQLSHQIKRTILLLVLEKLSLQLIRISKDINKVFIFLTNSFLILEEFSCSFQNIHLHSLHLSLLLLCSSLAIKRYFLFCYPF